MFEDAGPTYQSVLRDFAHVFAKDIGQYSDRQLTRLATLVVRAIETPSALGSAMEECFLAEARELKVYDRIAPFLAAARK